MNPIILIIIFLISTIILYFASEAIINSLTRLSKFFGITEFVLSFFIIAFASSIPNLFIGITSAMKGIPELSFGDVMGNNIIALTVAIGLAVLFSPNKNISSGNKTVRGTIVFTLISSLLPLVLIYDGVLDRLDGILLISFFIYYIFWLFSKKERFSKTLTKSIAPVTTQVSNAFKDLFKITIGFISLLIAAQGIVFTGEAFSILLGIPIVLVGVLILGLGSALPETYFAIRSARKNETEIILGNIMGAVIIPSTLILGITSLISPIHNSDFEIFSINRIFVFATAIMFFYISMSHHKITQKEAWLLLITYCSFIIFTIFFY